MYDEYVTEIEGPLLLYFVTLSICQFVTNATQEQSPKFS